MIKCKAESNDGKEILVLGLSELNVRKLKEGMPILINDDKFFSGKILITYGKTEERITADLLQFISKNTKIINETRGK